MTEASAFEKAVNVLGKAWIDHLEEGRGVEQLENARAALLAQHDRDIADAVAVEQARMAKTSTEGFIAALNRFEGTIQNRDSEGFKAARADVFVARDRDIAAEVERASLEYRAAVWERDARIRALEEQLKLSEQAYKRLLEAQLENYPEAS